jgi:hypothetical protein
MYRRLVPVHGKFMPEKETEACLSDLSLGLKKEEEEEGKGRRVG